MTILKMAYKATTIDLNSYLQSSGDRMLQAVLQYKKKKKRHSVVKESRKFKFQVNMDQEETDINTKPTKAAKDTKKKKPKMLVYKSWKKDEEWNHYMESTP